MLLDDGDHHSADERQAFRQELDEVLRELADVVHGDYQPRPFLSGTCCHLVLEDLPDDDDGAGFRYHLDMDTFQAVLASLCQLRCVTFCPAHLAR